MVSKNCNTEAYLEACQAPMMKILDIYENSERLLALNYFCKKPPSYILQGSEYAMILNLQ